MSVLKLAACTEMYLMYKLGLAHELAVTMLLEEGVFRVYASHSRQRFPPVYSMRERLPERDDAREMTRKG